MSATPPVARAMNHVAYVTTDTNATIRFYTEVLGLRHVHTIAGDRDASGAALPHLHTFFALASGECLAFFEIEGARPGPPDSVPRWARHIALGVDSATTLAAWQEHLRAKGVEVFGPVDHDGVWASIYFTDPNGIMLELTHQSRDLTPAEAAAAPRIAREWLATHGRG
jgi:catechol 2,3-dioxygenase-like lactoylglutathione lyase family enzyme